MKQLANTTAWVPLAEYTKVTVNETTVGRKASRITTALIRASPAPLSQQIKHNDLYHINKRICSYDDAVPHNL